jgi:hypothetical protein
MMWTHVSDAALMDVIEGSAGDREAAHVQGCARCRARVEEARAGLALAAPGEVPEPMPAFWEVLRRRVAVRIEEAPAVRSRRPLWAAATLAGAAVIAALSIVPTPAPSPSPAAPVAALPAWSPLPPADEDPGLPLLEHAVTPVMAVATPDVGCADVAECVAGLTDEESGALADALRQQLGRGRPL